APYRRPRFPDARRRKPRPASPRRRPGSHGDLQACCPEIPAFAGMTLGGAPALEKCRRIPISTSVSGGHSIITARIADDAAGWRLDRALAAAVPTLSRERLKALISGGSVLGPQGGAVRDPATKAVAGGTYEVSVPAPAAAHN